MIAAQRLLRLAPSLRAELHDVIASASRTTPSNVESICGPLCAHRGCQQCQDHHRCFSSAAASSSERAPTDTANDIIAVREKIFGKPIVTGERTGRRRLAAPLKGKDHSEWYMLLPPDVPGLHNEEAE